jgi:hypothetical protein
VVVVPYDAERCRRAVPAVIALRGALEVAVGEIFNETFCADLMEL